MTPLLRPMKCFPLIPTGMEHTDDNILAQMRKLTFPKLVSKKKDGIRFVRTTDLYSCRMKLIPNVDIRRRSMILPYGFDGELCNDNLEYHEVESIVMSEEHPQHKDIYFYMIDWYQCFKPEDGYTERLRKMGQWLAQHEVPGLVMEAPRWVYNAEEMMQLFLLWEQEGFEGICFRSPEGQYKFGYSTWNEQTLGKLCRYLREEVTVIALKEQMANTNRKKTNAIGLTERSSMLARQKGKGTLGAFSVIDREGREYDVGGGEGLTQSKRQEIWDNQDKWIGKQITIKYKPYGTKDKPRSPIYVGPREEGY